MQPAERNGVRLAYADVPSANAHVVLIQGWCCDHTYLAPQFEHFANKGRWVVAPSTCADTGRATSPWSAIRCKVSPTTSPSSAIILASRRRS